MDNPDRRICPICGNELKLKWLRCSSCGAGFRDIYYLSMRNVEPVEGYEFIVPGTEAQAPGTQVAKGVSFVAFFLCVAIQLWGVLFLGWRFLDIFLLFVFESLLVVLTALLRIEHEIWAAGSHKNILSGIGKSLFQLFSGCILFLIIMMAGAEAFARLSLIGRNAIHTFDPARNIVLFRQCFHYLLGGSFKYALAGILFLQVSLAARDAIAVYTRRRISVNSSIEPIGRLAVIVTLMVVATQPWIAAWNGISTKTTAFFFVILFNAVNQTSERLMNLFSLDYIIHPRRSGEPGKNIGKDQNQ